MCPQFSGGHFCQVVARTGSTVYSRLVGKSQLPSIKNLWDPMQARAVLPCHSLFDCLFLPGPVSCRGQRIARSDGKRNRSFTENITIFAAVVEVLLLITMYCTCIAI